MEEFKFNPFKYGYEKAKLFPELIYTIPVNIEDWFIKILSYDDYDGLVYCYSAIELNNQTFKKDIIRIFSGLYDFSSKNNTDKQLHYFGLISTHKFAKDLLSHLFAITHNYSVNVHGIVRLNQNIGAKMRNEFSKYYIKD